MWASLTFSPGILYGFLLVLTRVAGAFVFVPIPGVKDGPQPARIVMALAITIALYPRWPQVSGESGGGWLAGAALAEAAFGMTVGLTVSLLAEALLFAAQVTGMQAGFSYASMVDPTTQADSSVLLVMAQLIAGLLFFAIGIDRQVVRLFARSLETYPPGSFRLSAEAALGVIRFAGETLAAGLKLALPVVALLLLVDLSLALLGRLNAQLQLLSMAFPAKMMAALLLVSWMAAIWPSIYTVHAGKWWRLIEGIVSTSHG
jgi:flagellar biosynthetic protein FliR